MTEQTNKRETIPLDSPFVALNCKTAFEKLTKEERVYAHHLSEVSWLGCPIAFFQTSPESPILFYLLIEVLKVERANELKNRIIKDGVLTEEEVNAMLLYLSGFLGNTGNYKSFGDSKFFPALEEEKFSKFFESTNSFKSNEKLNQLLKTILPLIYDDSKESQQLGMPPNGLTTYFSKNTVKADSDNVQEWLDSNNISAYNTRLCKDKEGNIAVRQASANSKRAEELNGTIKDHLLKSGKDIKLQGDDYKEIMDLMCVELNNCVTNALNQTEKDMLTCYKKSFEFGDINDHKEGSKHWVKDQGPIVETYMGFIESYRDPAGVRGEFESFVSVVNKDTSKKFGQLVANAPEIIANLPWPKSFEKDEFLKPDFTALDVLTFASSGIPIGINIPNYDDIRQDFGFKNVYLQNVVASRLDDPTMTFLAPSDKPIYKTNVGPSLEVQVALHELLGHGTGKLFSIKEDGEFNFDKSTTVDPFEKKPIDSWYKPGETWDSLFKQVGSAYEESRAEAVAIYLTNVPKVKEIFGGDLKGDGGWEDCSYINWLSMARSGLTGIEFYSPAAEKWGQAHCQARFAILKVMLEAGDNFLLLEEITGEDGKPDIQIKLDRTKIISVGMPAIGKYLEKLQYYKSTGKAEEGTKYFTDYTNVTAEFLKLRDIVVSRRKPRYLVIQPNTAKVDSGDVEYREYSMDSVGMLQSFADRYCHRSQLMQAVHDIWQRDRCYFDL